jgi:DNA-binding transcriptional MerR regulator
MGLVVPEKIGEGKKPVVLYNEKQIEQLRLINTATEFLSLDGIRLALKKKRLSEVVEALVEILN